MNIEIPQFSTKEALFDFLIENKSILINQKKSAVKLADGIAYMSNPVNDKDLSVKASTVIGSDANKIMVRSVINTTKLLDSHMDVHINGLWKKSLSEKKEKYLIEEHRFNFKGIISDEVDAYTKILGWKGLGFNFEGNTEALVYDSVVHKDRNPYMFEQYAKKRVKNHSVGMRYIKLYMCINSKMYQEEQENWDKYYPEVANKEVADAAGYFWAVTEATDIEGSAVILGSNYATPTLGVTEDKHEPVKSTRDTEPVKSTQLLQALNDLKTKI